jgi:hypothetical protein
LAFISWDENKPGNGRIWPVLFSICDRENNCKSKIRQDPEFNSQHHQKRKNKQRLDDKSRAKNMEVKWLRRQRKLNNKDKIGWFSV